jgi:hypothetical protein
MKTTEEYLRENSVLDSCDSMDGTWVPLSIAMIAIDKAVKGELQHNNKTWIIKSKKDELNKLVNEYYKKYPYGEFSFSPMYSYDETRVEGIIFFDWKCQVYHIEDDPIEEVIELIKSLKK